MFWLRAQSWMVMGLVLMPFVVVWRVGMWGAGGGLVPAPDDEAGKRQRYVHFFWA